MIGPPDRVYVVKIWGGDRLTEKGWDTFQDTLDAAALEDVVHDAVVEALTELPYEEIDKWDRAWPLDWYTLRVEEASGAAGGLICPDPAHHSRYTVKSALRAAQEPTQPIPDDGRTP